MHASFFTTLTLTLLDKLLKRFAFNLLFCSHFSREVCIWSSFSVLFVGECFFVIVCVCLSELFVTHITNEFESFQVGVQGHREIGSIGSR